MTNWENYVKESYTLIKRAENELCISLEHNLEAYIVHVFAHFLDKPNVNTEPLGIKLMASNMLPVPSRKAILKEVGDECLIINAMGWGKRKWPHDDYYAELGQTAYLNRAFVVRPADALFDNLALNFSTATNIIRKCRNS